MYPSAFQQTFENSFPDQWDAFEEALAQPSPVSLRLNPHKVSTLASESEVLWHQGGRYLAERPVFALDPLFHAGAYYVQEASSMFVATAAAQFLDFSKPLRVLDLCAAPGGKSTTLIDMLNAESLIMCNEVIKSRIGALKENIEKWGFDNVIVANHDPEEMVELEGYFDLVLVDAPCSGEGLWRKDPKAVNEWSEDNVKMCSARQKRILQAANMLVKPHGFLIYSTCTYNATENDENAKYILQNFDFELQNMELKEEWGITKTPFGCQFMPHKTKGEGFYISIFKKTEGEEADLRGRVKLNAVPKKYHEQISKYLASADDFEFFFKSDNATVVALRKSLLADYGHIFRAIFKRNSGFEIGMLKGQELIPSHALALSRCLSANIPRVDIDKENALKYLKRETFTSSEFSGWALITHQNLALGWAKGIGDRVNNYLPKEWRLRMDID